MQNRNMILNTDSYKASHWLQYPPGTTYISSYIESRGGAYPATVFFGLQMFLKEYLTKPISLEDIDEAEAIMNLHGVPFNREGWVHIYNEHGGYLPVEIEAVPEGTIVPTGNVLVQIINTDPKCAWLVSYLETALLRAVWYPTTVATLSRVCRSVIEEELVVTEDSARGVEFRLHDFGARGVSSEESAAIGACAHLVNFSGTDTLSGVLAAKRYYNAPMAGFSIPAAEHSTITSWGMDGEKEAYENMIDQFGDGVVAVVSDSYDLWNAVQSVWGVELHDKVVNMKGRLVVRPDSGAPDYIVPEIIDRLMDAFGYTVNPQGYKVLHDKVRVIQGDGVCIDMIRRIYAEMRKRGQSAENISFGMGGELLQKVHRDTMRFAMKASAIRTSYWRDVFKAPTTDPKKCSKGGRLALVADEENGSLKTVRRDTVHPRDNLLVPVFRNGELLVEYQFDDIRARVQSHHTVGGLL